MTEGERRVRGTVLEFQRANDGRGRGGEEERKVKGRGGVWEGLREE